MLPAVLDHLWQSTAQGAVIGESQQSHVVQRMAGLLAAGPGAAKVASR